MTEKTYKTPCGSIHYWVNDSELSVNNCESYERTIEFDVHNSELEASAIESDRQKSGGQKLGKQEAQAETALVLQEETAQVLQEETALVFLPGLTADHRLFDKQVAHFKDKCRVLVWDAPAHGASWPFSFDFERQGHLVRGHFSARRHSSAHYRGTINGRLRRPNVQPIVSRQAKRFYLNRFRALATTFCHIDGNFSVEENGARVSLLSLEIFVENR